MGILWQKGICTIIYYTSLISLKTGQAFPSVCPKMSKFTCVAHALHLAA